MLMSDPVTDAENNARQAAIAGAVLDALHDLRFGSVVITVQDGVIVQIDRTEKRRLHARTPDSSIRVER